MPLPELDVVFTSYENLRKELAQNSPLLNFGFWRIMLDEAQLVANTNSVAAVMASQLWRRHAWVVTGTPVSSRLNGGCGGSQLFRDLLPDAQSCHSAGGVTTAHSLTALQGSSEHPPAGL